MNPLNGIAEMLEFVEECLTASDWDRLQRINPPPLEADASLDRAGVAETLHAVEAMQHEVRKRMDAAAAEINRLPEVRRAAQAYLGR